MKKRLTVCLLLLMALFLAPHLRTTARAAAPVIPEPVVEGVLSAPEAATIVLEEIIDVEPAIQYQSTGALSLSSKSLSLPRNYTKTLSVYQRGQNVRKQASWTSSNQKVATVKAGVVTAKGFGTCTVTAKKDGYRVSCQVSVKPGKAIFSSVKRQSAGKIALRWKTCSGVSGYQLYRSTAKQGTYCKVKTFSSSSSVSYVNTVTRNKTYYYKLRAYYKTSKGVYLYGAWSDIKQVKA